MRNCFFCPQNCISGTNTQLGKKNFCLALMDILNKSLPPSCLKFIYERPHYKNRFNVTWQISGNFFQLNLGFLLFPYAFSWENGVKQEVSQTSLVECFALQVVTGKVKNTTCVKSKNWHQESVRFWKKSGKDS